MATEKAQLHTGPRGLYKQHIRLHIPSFVAQLEQRLYREWKIYTRGKFRGEHIKYAIRLRNLFFQTTLDSVSAHYLTLPTSFSRNQYNNCYIKWIIFLMQFIIRGKVIL